MARLGRRWRNFGCAGSGFRTEGGDPGEKVLHVDASLDRGGQWHPSVVVKKEIPAKTTRRQ